MSISVNISPSELKKLDRDLKRYGKKKENEINRAVVDMAFDAVSEMKSPGKTPRDTSFMVGAINHSPIDKSTQRIESPAEYSSAVEYGTKAHTIRAKNKKVLKSKYGVFFGKKVRHPGTKAQPFFYPVVNKHYKIMVRKIQILLSKKK